MDILVDLLAGLGFIFIGTQFLTANMKQAVGARFQSLIARATGNPFKSAAAGMAAGAIIQSTNAVTFIVIGLVTAGTATVQQAMPIVTWSYAGSTLRLLLLSFDIKEFVMCGIAVLGVLFLRGYDRDPKWRNLISALLGLALLLYGVDTMASAATPLGNSASVREFLSFAQNFYPWGLIAGTMLSSVIGGQIVSVIGVALATGGLLDIDQTFLVVLGANLGSGLSAVTQGAGLSGTARQLNLYQLILKFVGVSIFFPALMIEHYTGVPLIKAFILSITATTALQVTALHWMFQLVTAAVATPINAPLYALLQRWSPPTTNEILGRPMYIGGLSDVQSSVASELIEKEQARLFSRLPYFLDSVRPSEEHEQRPSELAHKDKNITISELRTGGSELVLAIEKFAQSSLEEPSNREEHATLLFLWSRCQTLRDLQAVVDALSRDLLLLKSSPLQDVAINMAEAVHALLLTVQDEVSGGGERFPGLLQAVTFRRAETLRLLRQGVLERLPAVSIAQRRSFWAAIDRVENLMWLLQRYDEDGMRAAA